MAGRTVMRGVRTKEAHMGIKSVTEAAVHMVPKEFVTQNHVNRSIIILLRCS
jgi:hypothetical protein